MSSATRRGRKIAAELAAASTLLFASVSTAGFYERSLAAYTGRGYGLLAIVLSVVAFALSLRIRSPSVAGMLISGGVIVQIPPVQAIAAAGAIAVPGPVLGVISFGIILILGLVKAIGLSARQVVGAHDPEKAGTGPGISVARFLANALPEVLALSPTSAFAIIVSLLAFSRLHGSPGSASARPEPMSASAVRAGTVK